jgi:hypothetical protein
MMMHLLRSGVEDEMDFSSTSSAYDDYGRNI